MFLSMNKNISILTITLAWLLPLSLNTSYKGRPSLTDILQATNAHLTKISSETTAIYNEFNQVAESIEYLDIPSLSYQDLRKYVQNINAQKKSLSGLFDRIIDQHNKLKDTLTSMIFNAFGIQ